MMDSMPTVGDIIFTDRGLYKHFGIYIGNGNVIHFSAPIGDETNPEEADIFQTTVKNFLKDGELFIVREKNNSEYKPFTQKEIVERAESKLGKCKGTYSLVSNNCEHFAYWCRYGKKESKQVDSVATVVTAVGFFPLIILNALSVFLENRQKNANTKKLNSIGMKEIIEYFKLPRRLELLKKDENKIAIAIKENCNKVYKITCCIFDKKTTDIIDFEDIIIFKTQKIEDDLIESFGDKDMIILQ